MDELILDEPEIVKQGSRFGVKLKARAPSIHLIKAEIETEVSPLVGSEKQSEELRDIQVRRYARPAHGTRRLCHKVLHRSPGAARGL